MLPIPRMGDQISHRPDWDPASARHRKALLLNPEVKTRFVADVLQVPQVP